jgi:hypothetical protein
MPTMDNICTVMSDPDPDMTLWCLLKGANAPFPVTTSPTTHIAMLKDIIIKTIKKTDIPAYGLTLWKVCCF